MAIARAVANGPRLLLADEPTGNLDPKTADHVFEALEAIVRATGLATLIATHNMELASRMDRRVTLHEGLVGGARVKLAWRRCGGRARGSVGESLAARTRKLLT